ncbi:dCTP deaminase/dUTPase family protein [Peptostreptococcus faecalis]|uniref:deoxyuridine 5'-triphosphate nucleotidohydrolase n=1 Tax=Peptostreptococcus faecalis TaxID=2045015 RepID=UPI000C7A2537|nr:deoxyuridine 5'-triphosphate nucleotidohydrolase [Peptostreptococcus faecalis]
MRKFEIVKDNKRKNKNTKIRLPKRGTNYSAGYDFCTPVDIEIEPYGTSELIFTDVKACMNKNEVLLLHIRSSLGIKQNLVLANTTGVIDSDYYENEDNDGNIGFKLRNLSDKTVRISAGERVFQGIFMNYLTVDDEENLETARTSGFGSTGN